eukprot:CAMPEP_0177608816 /NCGR_PEP_ID=MMETSP0419_2-20121207/18690_1 /TAXON_ID=582737 /ORGANISM="Tetraselmis sp., Strain GSL018" /LENGTH=335 /DNA_ID=CAMNT_0019103565 /DNA_START=24 /DNA_END=1031 /DNA_ORIENTATION=-
MAGTAEQLKQRGYKLVDAGDFSGALTLFRKAAEQDSENAVLRELCAQCLLQMERWDEAYLDAIQAQALDPSSFDSALTLGRAARNAGYIQEALKAFRSATTLDSSDPEAREELGEIEKLWQREVASRVGVDGLEIHESWGAAEGAGPGGVVWDCGVALGQCITAGWPLRLQGRRVLELGAGTGIAGIVAAICGAHVTMTDLPSIVPSIKANIDRNKLLMLSGGSASAEPLDWGGATPLPRARGADASAWDVIIGADLVYSADAVAPLAELLWRLGKESSPVFLMVHKSRGDSLDAEMDSTFRARGLELRKHAWPVGLDQNAGLGLVVYTARMQSG